VQAMNLRGGVFYSDANLQSKLSVRVALDWHCFRVAMRLASLDMRFLRFYKVKRLM